MTSSIIGIPTSRISNLYLQQQMLEQLQYTQSQLARVETQLATGHQFDTPSENPIAAMRVVSLQQLLSRKAQMQTNISANQSYLSTTDSALMNVSNLLAQARATAIGVMGSTSSDTQRQTAVQQIDQVLQQLVSIGNQQFRGRYLFGGSQSNVQPFRALDTGIVQYAGNENSLSAYADVNQLFNTNLTGSEVFGAISTAVQGTPTLTPNVTLNTRLADLRQGQGITPGSIMISVASGGKTVSSTVDLSTAETIGDVAAMIKAHAPQGTPLDVEVTTQGLVVEIASPASGSLAIQEVGGGTTADQLGILRPTASSAPVVGNALHPTLRPTTSLDGILGARAAAVVHSGGPDNDFLVRADVPGETNPADGNPFNQVPISFQDDGSAGNEQVDYNGTSIVVHIDPGHTTAEQVVAAINAKHDLGELPFTAELDPLDSTGGGKGLVDVRATAQTEGGWGEALDKTGLQVINAGKTTTIDLSSAKTVEDLLNTINGSGAGLLAEINADQTGIDVRSRASGCDFAIGENGGKTASQLGLRTFTADTRLADLNYGRGVQNWSDGSSTNASVTLQSLGDNNDLKFTARNSGPDWNNFTVTITNAGATATPGITYDKAHKKIDIQINDTTTASDIVGLFTGSTSGIQDDWDLSLPDDNGKSNDGKGGVVAAGGVMTEGGDSPGSDFYITRADGVKLTIDVAGAKTIGDVLGLINNNPDNADGALTARLAASGNGIELVDNSTGAGQLTVTCNPLSTAAIDLGLVPIGANDGSGSPAQSLPPVQHGADGVTGPYQTITGSDVHPLETESVFTALLRIEQGLQNNDDHEVQRAMTLFDRKVTDMNFAQAELGAREQGLDAINSRLDAENVELKSVLSDTYDANMENVVTDVTGRQLAYQASLKATAMIFSMSLLNYL